MERLTGRKKFEGNVGLLSFQPHLQHIPPEIRWKWAFKGRFQSLWRPSWFEPAHSRISFRRDDSGNDDGHGHMIYSPLKFWVLRGRFRSLFIPFPEFNVKDFHKRYLQNSSLLTVYHQKKRSQLHSNFSRLRYLIQQKKTKKRHLAPCLQSPAKLFSSSWKLKLTLFLDFPCLDWRRTKTRQS